MRSDRQAPRGSLHSLTLESALLRDNLLGDPTRRDVPVYLPAGHDGKDLPLLVDLVGFPAGGPVHLNWKNFGENLPERLDRLIAARETPPVGIPFPDSLPPPGGHHSQTSLPAAPG